MITFKSRLNFLQSAFTVSHSLGGSVRSPSLHSELRLDFDVLSRSNVTFAALMRVSALQSPGWVFRSVPRT